MDTMLLARKYARVVMRYFDLYHRDSDFLLRLMNAIDFLRVHKGAFFYADKQRYMTFFTHFGFEKRPFELLLEMLVMHKRFFLLRDILKSMVDLYQEHNRVEVCRFMSSHDLDEQQCKQLNDFFERSLQKKIWYRVTRDKSLIAGVRVRGKTFIWEDSIAQRLRLIEQSYW